MVGARRSCLRKVRNPPSYPNLGKDRQELLSTMSRLSSLIWPILVMVMPTLRDANRRNGGRLEEGIGGYISLDSDSADLTIRYVFNKKNPSTRRSELGEAIHSATERPEKGNKILAFSRASSRYLRTPYLRWRRGLLDQRPFLNKVVPREGEPTILDAMRAVRQRIVHSHSLPCFPRKGPRGATGKHQKGDESGFQGLCLKGGKAEHRTPRVSY